MASRQSIALGGALTTGAAIIIQQYVESVISTIRMIGGGINDNIDAVGSFFEFGLLGGLYHLAGSTIRAAFQAHGVWLADTFGGFAQLVAIVEVLAIVWLLGVVLKFAVVSMIPGVA